MTREPSRLARYALEGVNKVEGWLQEGAMTSTLLVSQAQRRRGIEGDIGEIGVHHGKFFLLLALLREPREVGVAVDVFEDQHLNVDHSGKGDRAVFEKNIEEHLGSAGRIRVVKSDSLALAPQKLAGYAATRFRLFSIDGGHTVAHIINDLGLAEGSLHASGVVIVDDFFHLGRPGVTEGLFRYWESGGMLRPFAYGEGKLFLCRREERQGYYDIAARALFPLALRGEQTDIGGERCLWLTMPPPAAAMLPDGRIYSTYWSFLDDGNGRALLQSGWSTPGSMGVWSVGRQAGLTLPLDRRQARGDSCIVLSGIPFIPPDKGRQGVSVSVNGRALVREEFTGYNLTRMVFDVPQSALLPEGNTLELTLDHPASPASYGLSWDERELAFQLSGLSFFDGA